MSISAKRIPGPPSRIPGPTPILPPPGGPPAIRLPDGGDISVPGPTGIIPNPPQRIVIPDAPNQGVQRMLGGLGGLGVIGGAALTGTALIRSIMGSGGQKPPAAPPQQPVAPPQPPKRVPIGSLGAATAIDNPNLRAAQRNRWLKEQAIRHRDAIARDSNVYSQLASEYDAAIAAGKSHDEARMAAQGQTGGHLDAQKSAQIAMNVQNQAKQFNTARQLGVPRGYVMAMEDINHSLRSGDLAGASAKAAMYGQAYGPSFIYASRNLAEMGAAQFTALGKEDKDDDKGLVGNVAQEQADLSKLPAGIGRYQAVGAYLGKLHQDPKALQQALANHYRPILQGMAGRFDQLSADERAEWDALMQGKSYQEWRGIMGLPESKQAQDMYQKTMGQNASYAQFYDNFIPGAGRLFSAVTPWTD